ncbi:CatB-related O-acetyltransferase [Clostridium sp. YIM B02505]|uniref:CatB-related O-acetyltransferase n=1 Tax=Clostridium yunnanense TaxID=2800325 RepID=A0ABS1ESF8_9CLOT|nr:CatB-related O-acetyltransferase [Clostridium yunnanense]MBK1812264.1 CatB-related O-acetyltransferase [Clostridium yunnanense]
MILDFSVPFTTNPETNIYYINLGIGDKFPIACVGRESYIVGGKITSGADFTISEGYAIHNLQVGQFVSIAHCSDFTMGLGHDYLNLATGVSKLFKENNEYNYDSSYREKGQILIQNDVWLGHNVTVMAGVTIHNGAIVASNSHVVKDVPPYAIVGGNPAKIIKYRFSEEIIDKLLTIQWWNWSSDKIIENNEFFKSEDVVAFCNKFYYEALENKKKVKDIQMQKMDNTYLFFMDFTEPYAIWQRVIREFIKKFKLKADHLLILYIDEEFANNNTEAIHLLNKFIAEQLVTENPICSVSICIENKENERAMFRKTDYFITNRSKSTILHSEYAYENKVKVISGVDMPIF